MKKCILILAILIVPGLIQRCSPARSFILAEPIADQSLLIGAILVENAGLEDVYEVKKANITVIIVGKSTEDGKETTKGYRVKTNPDGYYLIPNVPTGSYVIKGIELDLGYETHLLIGSYWDGGVQVYHPEQMMIDYTVRVWPAESSERIMNLNIRYFRIDAAKRVMYRTFKRIESNSVNSSQIQYAMINPFDYFKMQYPASGWFRDAN